MGDLCIHRGVAPDSGFAVLRDFIFFDERVEGGLV